MKRIRGKHQRWTVLTMATLFFSSVGQVIAQPNDSTTTSTTTSTQTQTDQLLQNTEFHERPRDTVAGMPENINLRKDAWTWYWDEKAHVEVDPDNKGGFWGNDGISLFFKGIADNAIVPFWNGAMQYDFVRAASLLVLAGMLLGFGASLMMPTKEQK